MTKREILEAALALDTWMKSQDIKGFDRTLVMIHCIAADVVASGNTPERFDTGMQLVTQILKGTCYEAMDQAKKMGLHK